MFPQTTLAQHIINKINPPTVPTLVACVLGAAAIIVGLQQRSKIQIENNAFCQTLQGEFNKLGTNLLVGLPKVVGGKTMEYELLARPAGSKGAVISKDCTPKPY